MTAPPAAARRVRRHHRTALVTGAAVAGWVALLVFVRLWGLAVVERAGRTYGFSAVPLVGEWEPRRSWVLVVPAGLAAAAVAWGPPVGRRLRWRPLLAVAAGAHAAWVLALGAVDGRAGLEASLGSRFDHLAAVALVGSPGRFLRGFVAALPGYPTHVKSHPPGTVLVLWVLDRLGLGGTGPALALVLAGGALAVVAALVALRELAGEDAARRASLFVALAPAAVWATNADALYAGMGALAVALVVVATGRDGRRADGLAAAGGAALGAGLLLSYGLALLAVPIAAVTVARRRVRALAVAAVVAAAVVALPAAWGFWWPDGLAATRAEYADGLARVRPYGYFVVANLAVFALAIGPATAAALARLRDRGAWLLVGGTLVAVAVADLSGLSKGEVERIWQPFVPLVMVACCALPGRGARWWLAVQLALGVALQAALRSPW